MVGCSVSICSGAEDQRSFDKLDGHLDTCARGCVHPSAYGRSQPAIDHGGEFRRQMKDAHRAAPSSAYLMRTARNDTAPVWLCSPTKPERGSWLAVRPRVGSLFVKIAV